MKRPTLDKILSDLETAKQMAIEDRHITGIITASMAQAKLLGYDKGEIITVSHNQSPTFNIQPVRTLSEIEKAEFEQIALEVLAKV